jgi:SAM-dependent methyltransferase
MTAEPEIKQRVREFYDQVGWKAAGEAGYQNARYEDLRPVAREYIQRCHLRVRRHLKPTGAYLLDAGSGPIQYPEYLEYQLGYQARVCVDISIVALQEARRRIGDRQDGGRGLFVVADIANLPFTPDLFEGVVSLHTIHHLPVEEHLQAYAELYRVLAPGCSAVVVNGWQSARLMRPCALPIRWSKRLRRKLQRLSRARQPGDEADDTSEGGPAGCGRVGGEQNGRRALGTFVRKQDAAWLKSTVGSRMPLEILVWRTVNVGFLRTFIHAFLAGRWWLRLLFWLEERYPHFFGENGQYPLIVIRKQIGAT